MNDARSAERLDALTLLVDGALLAVVLALAVLELSLVDCRPTRNDCRLAINCDAESASLDELELAVSLVSDASSVASGGGPGGGPDGGANCVVLVAELEPDAVIADVASACVRCCCNICHWDKASDELETDPTDIAARPQLTKLVEQRPCHVNTSGIGSYSVVLSRHFVPGGRVCSAASDVL